MLSKIIEAKELACWLTIPSLILLPWLISGCSIGSSEQTNSPDIEVTYKLTIDESTYKPIDPKGDEVDDIDRLFAELDNLTRCVITIQFLNRNPQTAYLTGNPTVTLFDINKAHLRSKPIRVALDIALPPQSSTHRKVRVKTELCAKISSINLYEHNKEDQTTIYMVK